MPPQNRPPAQPSSQKAGNAPECDEEDQENKDWNRRIYRDVSLHGSHPVASSQKRFESADDVTLVTPLGNGNSCSASNEIEPAEERAFMPRIIF
jgi:hypothetical protein